MKFKEKGITLIALVITIIILLILAGVAINLTIGENGIFTKARYGKEQHEKAEVKERLDIAIAEINIEEITEGRDLTLDTLLNKLATKLDGMEISKDGNTLKGKYKGFEFIIDEKFKVTVGGKEEEEKEEDYSEYQEFKLSSTNYSQAGITMSGDVVIPASFEYDGVKYKVTAIDNQAFYMAGITSVQIPETVTFIGYGAFYRCGLLTEIKIPNSVTTIGYQAFYQCKKLTEIVIPNSVTAIGDSAFLECTNLTSINIPASVTQIGSALFTGCTNLVSITVDENNSVYDSRDNCNALIKTDTNEIIASCKNTTIPASVTAFGESSFASRQDLKEITIPERITTIGDSAFYNCQNLEVLKIENSEIVLGNSEFSSCEGLKELYLPASATYTDDSSFFRCSNLETIYITKGTGIMKEQDDYQTTPWQYLKYHEIDLNIIICDGVENISKNAFDYCLSLKSVEIADTVTDIGEKAFYRCENLNSLSLGNGVVNIGKQAFSTCRALNGELILPNSVTTLADGAFEYCIKITDLTLSNKLNNMGLTVFNGCTQLTNVEIPNGVTIIGEGAFISCTAISEITIPSSVTGIGVNAFYRCSGLTNAIFNTTTGWYVGASIGDKSTAIDSSQLEDTAEAKDLLVTTYRSKAWTRE